MNSFKGFDPNGFMLLEMNKFNDSKEFYESVKEDIKKSVIVPMRQLACDLSDQLTDIDPLMNTVPTKMVSRIRRDTRFSKNKNLYRDNVWCMFMRDKHSWKYQPCMWFEFFPDCYSYGVGIFRSDADYLDCFRKILADNQQELIDAIRIASLTGAKINIEGYKRPRPGTENIADELKSLYNCKSFWLVCYHPDLSPLVDGTIKTELSYALRAFEPLYKFLLKVTQAMYERGN